MLSIGCTRIATFSKFLTKQSNFQGSGIHTENAIFTLGEFLFFLILSRTPSSFFLLAFFAYDYAHHYCDAFGERMC